MDYLEVRCFVVHVGDNLCWGSTFRSFLCVPYIIKCWSIQTLVSITRIEGWYSRTVKVRAIMCRVPGLPRAVSAPFFSRPFRRTMHPPPHNAQIEDSSHLH